MRRVEDLALLSRFDAVGFDDGGFDNDVRIGIFIRHGVWEGSNDAAQEEPFGGTDMVRFIVVVSSFVFDLFGSAFGVLLRFQNRNLKSEFVLKSEFFRNLRNK